MHTTTTLIIWFIIVFLFDTNSTTGHRTCCSSEWQWWKALERHVRALILKQIKLDRHLWHTTPGWNGIKKLLQSDTTRNGISSRHSWATSMTFTHGCGALYLRKELMALTQAMHMASMICSVDAKLLEFQVDLQLLWYDEHTRRWSYYIGRCGTRSYTCQGLSTTLSARTSRRGMRYDVLVWHSNLKAHIRSIRDPVCICMPRPSPEASSPSSVTLKNTRAYLIGRKKPFYAHKDVTLSSTASNRKGDCSIRSMESRIGQLLRSWTASQTQVYVNGISPFQQRSIRSVVRCRGFAIFRA